MLKKTENTQDLARLEKLLDKIENELKKKRDEKIYSQTEKFVEHMKKTTDIYELVTEEIIGSLYIAGHVEHTNVLKKLFKGIQQQIKSVLQFSLKYYSRKNNELRKNPFEKDKKSSTQDDKSLVLINKTNGLPYCPLKVKATLSFHANFSKSTNQKRIAHSPKSMGPSDIHHFYQSNYKASHFNSYSSTRPQEFSTLTMRQNSFQGDQGYHSETYSQRRDFSMGHENFNPFIDPLHLDSEIEAFNKEHDQMQREIEELMEGKKNLESIGPSDVSTNLRQVLKGLTGFNKKLKAIGEGDDNEDDDTQNVDINGMTNSLMGAFDKAQKKTAKKAIGFFKAHEKEISAKVENGTMPDAEMLEAEKRFYRFESEMTLNQKNEELAQITKKLATIEQDRNHFYENFMKLSVEHSKCQHEEKELKMKVVHREKETRYLKEIIEDVKKGRVDKLFLSKEKEKTLIRNIQNMQPTEDISQVLMKKLQETRREVKILQYQLDHGKKPESMDLEDGEEEEEEMLSFLGLNASNKQKEANKSQLSKSSSLKKKIDKNGKVVYEDINATEDVGPVEVTEIEEEVVVEGKIVKVKKTVYKQLKKKVIINEKGEKEEIEGYEELDNEDVTVDSEGKAITKNMKITSDGKKMMKVISKDKNGKQTTKWVEVPMGVNINEGSSNQSGKIRTVTGNTLKKIIKKDKTGKEIIQWVDAGNESEDSEEEKVEKIGGLTIKRTQNGKVLTKTVIKDKKGRSTIQWVEIPEEGLENLSEIKSPNGKILKKVVHTDKNGKEIVQFVDSEQLEGDGKREIRTKRENRANGIFTMQEEVEEEVLTFNENGEPITLKKKIMKTKNVKKFVDENGEEVIEEEIVDAVTGEKRVERKKVKDLKNVKLVEATPDDSENDQSLYHSESPKKIRHKGAQTNFTNEEIIKSALTQAGVDSTALNEINKLLSKHGVDLTKPKPTKKKEVEEYFEDEEIPVHNKKKIRYLSEDVEEIEYITKEGVKVKKLIPKDSPKDFQFNEYEEVIYTGIKQEKLNGLSQKGRKYQGLNGQYTHNQTNQETFEESMNYTLSLDAEGNFIKNNKIKQVGFTEGLIKPSLDDYIRREEELEKNSPPQTKEEVQTRAMYKSMLTKAKQDPKLMSLFKAFAKEKGKIINDDETFIVDFDTFQGYLQKFKEVHGKCGESCSHLQRFYARIGYYPIWNNRIPLEMKKPHIANDKARYRNKPPVT